MVSNETIVKEFILLGFTVTFHMEIVLFCLVFIVYTLSIIINVTIIIVIRTEQQLHKPMYFFIGVFSFLEVWYPTVTVPGLLRGLLLRLKDISFGCCMAQFYLHFALGATENFLLVVMAFDRYVAICKPLHYMLIMKHRNCLMFSLGAWIGGFSAIIFLCIQLSQVTYCGPNKVDHYYCDFAPLVKLACSDTRHLETLFFMMSCMVILLSFLLIIVSYAYILTSILKLPANTNRKKAFYTCASHMIVVLIFYGTTIFMFIRPTSDKVHINKMVSLFPSVMTPLLNPIIYSLRNQDVKMALQKMTHCMEDSYTPFIAVNHGRSYRGCRGSSHYRAQEPEGAQRHLCHIRRHTKH